MNGQGVTIKQGQQVDHSLLGSKGAVLLEQQNLLVFRPENSTVKQSRIPAAVVFACVDVFV